MPFSEAIAIALQSLRAHKLRSFLTVLGILIGVSSVIAVVAITTVVPVRLIRSSSLMMPRDVVGSRFPVGSSASRIDGRLTNARAIATRCCSPPDSSCG